MKPKPGWFVTVGVRLVAGWRYTKYFVVGAETALEAIRTVAAYHPETFDSIETSAGSLQVLEPGGQ